MYSVSCFCLLSCVCTISSINTKHDNCEALDKIDPLNRSNMLALQGLHEGVLYVYYGPITIP